MDKILIDIKEEVELRVHNDVHYLILNKKANCFSPQFIRDIHEKLNIVEKYEGPLALVTVSTQKNMFSAGLDLKFLQKSNSAEQTNFLLEFSRLIGKTIQLGRFTVFPCPSIALIDGFCFAGGLALAMAHDFRYSTEESKFTMNEIVLNMPIPSGIFSALKHKLSNQNIKSIVMTGYKFDIIDKIIAKASIHDETIKVAEELKEFGENRQAQAAIKSELYREVLFDCFNRGLENGINYVYQISKL